VADIIQPRTRQASASARQAPRGLRLSLEPVSLQQLLVHVSGISAEEKVSA
jgi:hypothetical protein